MYGPNTDEVLRRMETCDGRMLHLGSLELTRIPDNLPETLEILVINDNQITKLENLPPRLIGLWFYDNQVTKLENLPDTLIHLWCGRNPLEEPYKQFVLNQYMRNGVDWRFDSQAREELRHMLMKK